MLLAPVEHEAGRKRHADADDASEDRIPGPCHVHIGLDVPKGDKARSDARKHASLGRVLGVEAEAEHRELGPDQENAHLAEYFQHRCVRPLRNDDGGHDRQHPPHQREPARRPQVVLRRASLPEELLVEIQRRDRRHRVQTGIEARHGRGHDGRRDHSHQPGKADHGHEVQHDPVVVVEVLSAVVAVEQDPDQEEHDIHQKRRVAHEGIGLLCVAQGFGRERALNHHLVHAVHHDVIDRHRDHAGPDRCDHGRIERVLERIGPADLLQVLQRAQEPARQVGDQHHGHDRRADEQDGALDQVRPDHRGDAAQHRVGDGDHGDDEDGVDDVHAGDELQHQRGRVEHDSGIADVAEQEHGRHQRAGGQPEPALQVVEDRSDAGVVEERQKERVDDEDDDRVVDVDEDDREAVLVRPGRSAQERDRAEIGRDHGHADHPPRRRALPQVVMLRRSDALAQEIAENQRARQVSDDNRPVQRPEIRHALVTPGKKAGLRHRRTRPFRKNDAV